VLLLHKLSNTHALTASVEASLSRQLTLTHCLTIYTTTSMSLDDDDDDDDDAAADDADEDED
jgi:hypothetical protein